MRSLLTLLCATLASAASLNIAILPSLHLPNPSLLPPSTHAVLIGPPGVRYDAALRRDNTLKFEALPEASYLLTIYSRDHFFPPLRVDVSKVTDGAEQQTIEAWQTFRGNEWSNKGSPYGSGTDALSIQIQASAQKEFYQTRGGFDMLGFLKSPMILMGLVSVVFIFGLPYIMDNMDPEMKQEFEEMQKKGPLTGSQGAATQMQNFDVAGWLAGKK
ncbi:hypothetical protein LTR62_004664 [Meristemomyces frigidus]|uniref:ER membrane protein complex subunit 7 beta-sandwich domain-containing protein n=1 Tax=Meristemomyces frigidus TaxID=1508187 RepID=A0AAN7TE57_9PEZI|nr:hypothetical protein LTR62_004664 [Meristemomyces frigidus]